MERGWALAQLQSFLDLHDLQRQSARIADQGGSYDDRADRDVVSQAVIVEKILNCVSPSWRSDVPRSQWDRWEQRSEAARRAVTLITRDDELRRHLGDDAPSLDADRFHPWAWEGARSMWGSRHYRQGVVDALKKVNAEAQNKSGRHDLSETDLFTQLFTADAPKAGAPRLRLMEDDGSDTFKNVHRGARALAEGLFAGIRNVVSHTVAESEADEQHALEQLAAVSVLARWVDDARVVIAP